MDRAQLDQHRRDSRAMWADGHYPTVAGHLLQAVEQLVESAGIAAGDRVLDVGTGSGAVAVAAARREDVSEGEAGPGDDPSNVDWGDPAYLCDRFASHDVDMTVERHVIEWWFPSLEAHEDLILTASGPYRRLREALEAKGVWDRAWAEIRELDRRSNKADDGTYAMDQEYLLAVGHRR